MMQQVAQSLCATVFLEVQMLSRLSVNDIMKYYKSINQISFGICVPCVTFQS